MSEQINMKIQIFAAIILGAVSFGLVGCDAGNAPAAMSPDEVRTTVNKKSQEDQIAFIEHSPMPRQEKDRQIANIKAGKGAAGKAPAAMISALEKIVVGGTKPDLTILMDLPPDAFTESKDGAARKPTGKILQ